MFCIKCGAKLSEDAKFCENCGQVVSQASGKSDSGGSSKRRKKKTGLIIMIGVIVVLLIAAIVGIFLMKDRGKENESANNHEISDNVQKPQENQEKLLYLVSSSETETMGDTEESTYNYEIDGYHVKRIMEHDGEVMVTSELEFDRDGQLISEKITLQSGVIQEVLYDYDENGNLTRYTSVTYDNEKETNRTVTNYTYGSNGMVTGISDNSGNVYKIDFNADGTVKAFETQTEGTSYKVCYKFSYENGYIQSREFTTVDEEGNITAHQVCFFDGTGTGISNVGNTVRIITYMDEEIDTTTNFEYKTAALTDEGIVFID